MKIFIVRHGETDSNISRKLAGQIIDEHLNADGVEQIKKLSEEIDTDFDVIFSSPLVRARQSAQILAEKIGAPIIERKEIMERNYGELSGRLWDEVAEMLKEKGIDWKNADRNLSYDFRPYRGECADDVKKRLLKFIEELKKDYSDKKVLIVAHGGILKMTHYIFNEIELEHAKNASIHEFDV